MLVVFLYCQSLFLVVMSRNDILILGTSTLATNGLGLAEVGDFEAQMFNLPQMYNRIPNAQFSTSAPILANPC